MTACGGAGDGGGGDGLGGGALLVGDGREQDDDERAHGDVPFPM